MSHTNVYPADISAAIYRMVDLQYATADCLNHVDEYSASCLHSYEYEDITASDLLASTIDIPAGMILLNSLDNLWDIELMYPAHAAQSPKMRSTFWNTWQGTITIWERV